MKKPTLAIIGCGWLGKHSMPTLETAYQLIATTGHPNSAQALPIEAYVYDWTRDHLPRALKKADNYLIAIAPSAGGYSNYSRHLKQLAQQLPPNANTIMISSSSVYAKQAGNYDESGAIDSNSAIYHAENRLRTILPHANILRCSGLFGDERLSGAQYAGKTSDLPNKRLNLVHYHDIAQALILILQTKRQASTYNLAHPEHPWRHDYYRAQAQLRQQPPPIFTNPQREAERIINGQGICYDTGFQYRAPPLQTF